MASKTLPVKKYKAKTSSKGQIVIPKPIRDALGIDENTIFLAYLQDGKISLIKQDDDLDLVFGGLGDHLKKQGISKITQDQFEADLEIAKKSNYDK